MYVICLQSLLATEWNGGKEFRSFCCQAAALYVLDTVCAKRQPSILESGGVVMTGKLADGQLEMDYRIGTGEEVKYKFLHCM